MLSSPEILRQTQFAEVSSAANTTSTTFVDLFSLSITINQGSYLIISFTSSGYPTAGSPNGLTYQLVLDGTPIRGCSAGAGSGAQNAIGLYGKLTWKSSSLSAGSHTVLIQWRGDSGSGNIRIDPSNDDEFAFLVVQEVSN